MKRGFSLIELMVVIAIVGLLAAVAVPLYRDYKTRAGIISAINVGTSLLNEAIEGYESQGEWPDTIAGGTITESVGTDVTGYGYIDFAAYFHRNSAAYGTIVTTAYEGAFIGFRINPELGQGIPGYSHDLPGVNAQFYLYARYEDGTLVYYCGAQNETTAIPFEYLPTTCQDTLSLLP